MPGPPDEDNLQGPRQAGQDAGTQAYRAASLDHNAVADENPGPFHGVEGRRQAAAAADKPFGAYPSR